MPVEEIKLYGKLSSAMDLDKSDEGLGFAEVRVEEKDDDMYFS